MTGVGVRRKIRGQRKGKTKARGVQDTGKERQGQGGRGAMAEDTERQRGRV